MAKDILYPLRRLHGILYEEKLRQRKIHELKKQFAEQFRENPSTVFLLMTPEHGNLGDHAIAFAIIRLLEKNSIQVIEISDKKLRKMSWEKQLGVFNGMPVLVCGGGNLER